MHAPQGVTLSKLHTGTGSSIIKRKGSNAKVNQNEGSFDSEKKGGKSYSQEEGGQWQSGTEWGLVR